MTTRKMLEDMVKDAASKPAAVYAMDACADCGGDLDSDYECCVDENCGGGRFDPLDIEYIVNWNGEVIGVVLTVSTGGPHIEVVCRDGFFLQARGYWSNDRAEWTGGERADFIVDYYDDLKPFSAKR